MIETPADALYITDCNECTLLGQIVMNANKLIRNPAWACLVETGTKQLQGESAVFQHVALLLEVTDCFRKKTGTEKLTGSY